MTRALITVYLKPLFPVLLALCLFACVSQKPLPKNNAGAIRYENGAESMAENLDESLPTAISQIQHRHQHDFKQRPMVALFASNEEFEATTGYSGQRVAGVSTPSGVFLSPPGAEPLRAILTHELSHVLLRQWMGDYRFYLTPIWFREGLATWAADGGGAGQVSAREAEQAILENRTFSPNVNEGLIFRKDASYWNMTYPMFYRQSALFVSYLSKTRPQAWRNLLIKLHQGSSFSTAVSLAFDEDINSLWETFILSLADNL